MNYPYYDHKKSAVLARDAVVSSRPLVLSASA